MSSVSCCMVTYGRFSCVERSIAMFLDQTYKEAELIIFHTDEEQPLTLKEDNPRIKIINNSKDYLTGQPYTNTGAIRRDCLTHASGKYYVCWDDDDIFLPYFLDQAVNKILKRKTLAWKPAKSFFRVGNKIELVQNVMEASCIVDLETVRKIGFNLHSGKEGLSWYTALRDSNQLNENETDYIPSYCFDWSPNENASHKQSGDIDNPNNFQNHIKASKDRPNGRFLDPTKINTKELYFPFLQIIDNY